jgi:hypothetical protein
MRAFHIRCRYPSWPTRRERAGWPDRRPSRKSPWSRTSYKGASGQGSATVTAVPLRSSDGGELMGAPPKYPARSPRGSEGSGGRRLQRRTRSPMLNTASRSCGAGGGAAALPRPRSRLCRGRLEGNGEYELDRRRGATARPDHTVRCTNTSEPQAPANQEDSRLTERQQPPVRSRRRSQRLPAPASRGGPVETFSLCRLSVERRLCA